MPPLPRCYDKIAPRLYGYLLRQTRERARAEDLVQQTMLHIHRARAASSRAPRSRRGRSRSRGACCSTAFAGPSARGPAEGDPDSALGSEHGAEEVVQAHELAERIAAILARIPESQRVAFELLKQEGLTVAEAAEVLGTTQAAVKLRAHRAYEALRASLGDAMSSFEQGDS